MNSDNNIAISYPKHLRRCEVKEFREAVDRAIKRRHLTMRPGGGG